MRKFGKRMLMIAVGIAVLGTIAAAVQSPSGGKNHSHPQENLLVPAAEQKLTKPTLELPQPVLRIRLSAGEQKTVSLPILNHTDRAVKILSVRSQCHCIRATSQVPPIPPHGKTMIPLLVSGALAGSQSVEIITDAGARTVTVQLVIDGRGRAVDIATRLAAKLDTQIGIHVLAILHDLRGEVRGCGCSASALGGLDRLATLQALLPAGQTTWLASGDWSGRASPPDIRSLLDRLEVRPLSTGKTVRIDLSSDKRLSLILTDRPLEGLADHDLIIATGEQTETVRNARVIVPRMSDGLGVDLVLLDKRGMPVAHEAIPLDGSLGSERSIAKALRLLQSHIDFDLSDDNLSHRCADCHQQAYQSWQASKHAMAFDSLSQTDQGSTCASCHTTAQQTNQRARHVHCQACHQNAQAHQDDPRQRTVMRDCLDCHDSRQHAEFDYPSAWLAIEHALDPQESIRSPTQKQSVPGE